MSLNLISVSNASHTPALNRNATLFAGRHTEVVAFLTVSGVLCITGTVTNFLTILAVWPTATGRSSFAWHMLHFVTVELVMCAINMPIPLFDIYQTALGTPYTARYCNLVQSLRVLIFNVFASVMNWCDAVLALNRCIALFFPHSYRDFSASWITLSLMIFTWIPSLTATLMMPIKFGLMNTTVRTPAGPCTWWTRPGGRKFGAVSAFLGTYIPYIIMGTGAILIFGKTYQMGRRPDDRPAAQVAPTRSVSRRLQKARMLLLMLLWTAVCVAPAAFFLYAFSDEYLRKHTAALIWLRVVPALRYSFTPVIMLLNNREYRQKMTRWARRFRAPVSPLKIPSQATSTTSGNQQSARQGVAVAIARAL